MKDDLDGVDLRLKAGQDSVTTAKIVTAVLNSTHRNADDFTVTIPAALLAQQQRTQTIFTYVMVAIAAISLLVGGIGIMNIVLATVMERTREIGIRRAMGARKSDMWHSKYYYFAPFRGVCHWFCWVSVSKPDFVLAA